MASKNLVLKGATWNGVESVDFPVSGGGTARYVETSDADATAADISNGKKAYVNGSLIVGSATAPVLTTKNITTNGTYNASSDNADGYSSVTVSVSGGGAVKLGVLRPDAELVQSWSYDKYIIADEGVTLPSYSTSTTTLKAAANLTISGTLDFDNYHYAVVYRGLTTPEYSTQEIGKGREEYYMNFNYFEPYNVVAGVTGQTVSQTISVMPMFIVGTNSYVGWYSASSLRNTTSSYGFYQNYGSNVSYSNNTLSLKTPDFNVTGNTNYFSQTYWDAIDDVRFQYIIELYRVPKTGSTVNGFVQTSVASHIASCANSASGTLT